MDELQRRQMRYTSAGAFASQPRDLQVAFLKDLKVSKSEVEEARSNLIKSFLSDLTIGQLDELLKEEKKPVK